MTDNRPHTEILTVPTALVGAGTSGKAAMTAGGDAVELVLGSVTAMSPS